MIGEKNRVLENVDPFDKRFLITLLKYCENTCGLKSVIEIHIVVFKH